MSTIVTRSGKGSPLTHVEVDANFTNLNTDKYQSGDAVSFTTLTATGQTSLGGVAGSESFRAVPITSAVNYVSAYGTSGVTVSLRGEGSDANVNLALTSKGASASSSNLRFYTNSLSQEQMRVSHTASAVNYVQVTGAATGNAPVISVQGSDATRGLAITTKGAGGVLDLQTGGTSRIQVGQSGTGIVDLGVSSSGGIGFQVAPTTNQVNYLRATGAVASSAPVILALGSDTNIDLALTPKGTGATVANGDFKMNSGYGSTAVAYGCRAWVNFNGTGTVAIRSSGNVSSITDNATGDYTVNFTVALVDANYSSSGWSQGAYANQPYLSTIVSKTTSAIRSTYLSYNAASYVDPAIVDVQIFR